MSACRSRFRPRLSASVASIAFDKASILALQLMSWMTLGGFRAAVAGGGCLRRITIRPGPFDQGASGMGVASFGDRPLPASLTAGIF